MFPSGVVHLGLAGMGRVIEQLVANRLLGTVVAIFAVAWMAWRTYQHWSDGVRYQLGLLLTPYVVAHLLSSIDFYESVISLEDSLQLLFTGWVVLTAVWVLRAIQPK